MRHFHAAILPASDDGLQFGDMPQMLGHASWEICRQKSQMKIFTESERREIADKINEACGKAAIEHPLPELFLNTFGDNPAFITSSDQWDQFDDEHMAQYVQLGAELNTDTVVCACPFQPHVDWTVFATRAGHAHLLHRFRLN